VAVLLAFVCATSSLHKNARQSLRLFWKSNSEWCCNRIDELLLLTVMVMAPKNFWLGIACVAHRVPAILSLFNT
jgi:hypothetical protein